jgi:hypothetical protein
MTWLCDVPHALQVEVLVGLRDNGTTATVEADSRSVTMPATCVLSVPQSFMSEIGDMHVESMHLTIGQQHQPISQMQYQRLARLQA